MKGHCHIPMEARSRGGRNPRSHGPRNNAAGGHATGGKNLTLDACRKGGRVSGLTKRRGAHRRWHWEPIKKKSTCPFCAAEIAAQNG